MDIASFRAELGLSLEAFAEKLGLKSKGHAADLENGNATPSVRVALELERLSDGRIDAAKLHTDVAMVRNAEPTQGAAA